MEKFTKEELMTIYFALDNHRDILKFQARYCRNTKVIAEKQRNIENIEKLIEKVDRIAQELCRSK